MSSLDGTSDSPFNNVWDLIEFLIDEYGNDIALTNSEPNGLESREDITYNEIIDNSHMCSLYLRRIGIKKGEVVAIISENTIDYIWQVLGCLRAGAVCALISAHLKPREIEHILGISKPPVVIAPVLSDEQGRSIVRMAFVQLLLTKEDLLWDNFLCFPIDVLTCIETHSSMPDVGMDDAAFILSSSGSTGLPKGVVITHRNIMTALQYRKLFMSEKGTTLGLMPFCHAYGLLLMLMAVCEKNSLIVMQKFSFEKLIEVIKKYEIKNLHIVPSLLISLSKLPDSETQDLASVRFVMTGAGPILKDHQKAFKRKLNPSAKLFHSYGMTESTFVTLFGEFNEDKPSSPGRLLAGVSAKVVNEEGVEVETGERGELIMTCPMIMRGYCEDEEATKAAFNNEGWLRSGDLVYVDEDGYFFIVERLKDLIKYQGYQISPTELEMVLTSLQGVQEAAIVGVPHDVFGEVPRAFIVKATNSNLTEDDIKNAISSELAGYKQLRGGVKFVEDLPKSPTGKILRGNLNRT